MWEHIIHGAVLEADLEPLPDTKPAEALLNIPDSKNMFLFFIYYPISDICYSLHKH